MSEITLQVSIGEALDKLSILSIKLLKIKEEEKKIEVIKEFNLLETMLHKYKEKYDFHFKILCKINESIWNKLEDFRLLEDKTILSKNDLLKQNVLFKDITNENDDRYRVKNKINILCDSNFKEQKGYKPKHAFVLSHLGLGDCIGMIGLVRYLSTKFDEVIVVCKDYYKDNLQLLYNDDKSIKLYPVKSDYDISVSWGFDQTKFEEITKNCKLYIAGHHIFNGDTCHPFTDLPFNFYDDLKIDRNYFWDYYHIPNVPHETDLYHLYQIHTMPYIFIHSVTSVGQMFNVEEAEHHFNFDRQILLVINPCENVYKEGDKFYEIAEKFINHPLFYYKTVIEKADKIILSDSSFFCFSICLQTTAKNIYLRPRYKENYNLDNLNKINKYIFW